MACSRIHMRRSDHDAVTLCSSRDCGRLRHSGPTRPDESETEGARAALDDEGQLRDVRIDGLLEGDGQGFAEAGREVRPEIVYETILSRIARSR